MLSVGRVQTPTLKLVVDRDREIARFVSVPYWTIDVTLSHAGQSFAASWMPPDGTTDAAGRCLQQPVAQQAADRIRAGRESKVLSVETERVREAACDLQHRSASALLAQRFDQRGDGARPVVA